MNQYNRDANSQQNVKERSQNETQKGWNRFDKGINDPICQVLDVVIGLFALKGEESEVGRNQAADNVYHDRCSVWS